MINTHVHAASSPKDKSFLEDVGARHFYMSSLGENLTALGMRMRDKDREVIAKYSLAECFLSGNTTIRVRASSGALPSQSTHRRKEEDPAHRRRYRSDEKLKTCFT